jgi:hypothetical protein
MSNLIQPTLQNAPNMGLAWPVKKTPKWSTIVQTPASMRGEVRVSLTPTPVWDFNVDLSYIKGDVQTYNSSLANLVGFYQRMQGAADDWLYQDPYDNTVPSTLIAFTDGSTNQYQIGRSLANGAFEPLQFVFPTQVKKNNAVITAGPNPSGVGWYCGVENLLNYSQDFSQTNYWVVTNLTDSHASIVAPDGTTTADALTAASNGTIFVQQFINPSLSPGDVYTFSVWLKVPTGTYDIFLVTFSPIAGIVGSTFVGLTTSWQRFNLTATVPFGSPINGVQIYATGATSGDVIHIWGAQLERWSSASSYVFTTNNAPQRPRGVLTFSSVPSASQDVQVAFTFYYRCRFLDDEWEDLEEFLYQVWDLKSLKFRSLLL